MFQDVDVIYIKHKRTHFYSFNNIYYYVLGNNNARKFWYAELSLWRNYCGNINIVHVINCLAQAMIWLNYYKSSMWHFALRQGAKIFQYV